MTHSSADSNLLFGILALQMDFIDRDQLIEGLHAWAMDKSRSLGDILVERGALAQPLCDTIQQLVRAQHDQGKASDKSIAALTVAFNLNDDLSRIHDAELEHTLSHAGSSGVSYNGGSITLLGPLDPERDDRFGESTSASGRFERIKLHSEGGLGTVWLAEDTELGRKVAVKEIKERYADDEPSRRRFTLEAEVTGGLEHPGIVPVYGYGQYRDGRPFYAMRFIRGKSLKDEIHSFHDTDWKKTRPGETREIVLRRLLSRFIDVCNTIYFAHRRGVLHRDIKPSNIMLGDYGETLVVDWGLAKTIGRFDEDSDASLPTESTLLPRASAITCETMAGHAIGSPPYMSPEQARGEQEILSPATDIYSLGATLYTLLTDRRPVDGNSSDEILQQVRVGHWKRPSEIKPDVPKPLEAICMKAMSLHPTDRYPTVRHLVRDVEQYLADEPVSAFREGLFDRMRRVSRRHRTLFMVSLASLALFSILSVTAAVLINHLRMDAQALAVNNEALANAESLAKREAMTRQAEAVIAKDRSDHVRRYLVDILRSPDPERDGREVTVVELLDNRIDELERSFSDDDAIRAELLGVIAETYYSLGQISKAVDLSRRGYSLSLAAFGAADRQTVTAQRLHVSALIAAGLAREALPIAVDNYKRSAEAFGKVSIESLQARQVLAECHLATGATSKGCALLENVYQDSKQSVGTQDRNTMIAAASLISAYVASQQYENAVRLGQETLAIQRTKLGNDHPLTLRTMTILATALQLTGRLDDAIAMLEISFDANIAKLGEGHPETVQSQFALILAYIDAGRERQAKSHIKELNRVLTGQGNMLGGDGIMLFKTSLLDVMADAELLGLLKGRKDVVQTLSSLSITAPGIAARVVGWLMVDDFLRTIFSADAPKRLKAAEEIRKLRRSFEAPQPLGG